MVIAGHYHNGVVLLDGGQSLPEGTLVHILPLTDTAADPVKPRTEVPIRDVKPLAFPFFPSSKPGSLNLTNERIAEILEEDDLPS